VGRLDASFEYGKPAAASELRTGERATVNYAHYGKQHVATRIAISPSGKTARAHKAAWLACYRSTLALRERRLPQAPATPPP
jgi:hypothetical protein